jgi:hypothetical protein
MEPTCAALQVGADVMHNTWKHASAHLCTTMQQQSSRVCLLDREMLHVQSHITSILQLETQQHGCVLLPIQLLLSATHLNNSNKQTSPANCAPVLQQLLRTQDNVSLVLQGCCATLSAASGPTFALPHAAVQSVCRCADPQRR